MSLQIRQNLASLGPVFASVAPSPTGCQGLFGKSLSDRKWSIGGSCKAQSAAIPVGMASICNAADPFKRPFDGWQGLSEQALDTRLDNIGQPERVAVVQIRVRVNEQATA